jgi:hypothetical protein
MTTSRNVGSLPRQRCLPAASKTAATGCAWKPGFGPPVIRPSSATPTPFRTASAAAEKSLASVLTVSPRGTSARHWGISGPHIDRRANGGGLLAGPKASTILEKTGHTPGIDASSRPCSVVLVSSPHQPRGAPGDDSSGKPAPQDSFGRLGTIDRAMSRRSKARPSRCWKWSQRARGSNPPPAPPGFLPRAVGPARHGVCSLA